MRYIEHTLIIYTGLLLNTFQLALNAYIAYVLYYNPNIYLSWYAISLRTAETSKCEINSIGDFYIVFQWVIQQE